jgi:hypothetical protein
MIRDERVSAAKKPSNPASDASHLPGAREDKKNTYNLPSITSTV